MQEPGSEISHELDGVTYVCAVDQVTPLVSQVSVPTSFNMSGAGWFTSNYYGQVWIQNLCTSSVIVLNGPVTAYQMAIGNQFPVTIYPGQYFALFYYCEGGKFIESGDAAMSFPFQINPIFGYSDTSLANNNYPWWENNSTAVQPVGGTISFWNDSGWSQGNVHVGITLSTSSVCGEIDSGVPSQNLSGNVFSDMNLAITPGNATNSIVNVYNSTNQTWTIAAQNLICDIAWWATYLNSAKVFAFNVIWVYNKLCPGSSKAAAGEERLIDAAPP